MGYDVDDNNAPALENTPTVSTAIKTIPTADECTLKYWNSYFFGGYGRGTVTKNQCLCQTIPMTNPIRLLLGSFICSPWATSMRQ